MTRILAVFLALLLVVGVWIAASRMTAAPQFVVDWMRANARPFDSTDPKSGLADLAALDSIVGDARLVGLGECTHGSREVFQMKHRVVAYLASEKGFRAFAIEANMPEAARVNEYVLTGQGDPRALIRGMYFWTWQTEEVLALVEWMREFNASGRGPIQFFGFDMQTPEIAESNVRQFVERVEPAYLDSLDSISRMTLRVHPSGSPAPRRGPEAKLLAAAAARTVTHLVLERDRFADATSDSEYVWTLENARIVEQATLVWAAKHLAAASFVRDSCMAVNVESILRHDPERKLVLWAHNSHVSRRPGYMGTYLQRSHPDYVVIGSTTARGTYRALDGRSVREGNALTPPPATSVENALARTGRPRFLLDLRRAQTTKAVADWLSQYRPMRSIGAKAMLDQFKHQRVGRYFDALVWIDSTSSAVPMSGFGR
jgi:erythromycin esterase